MMYGIIVKSFPAMVIFFLMHVCQHTKAGRRNLQPRADTKEGHKVKESSQGSGRLGPGIHANRTVTLRTRKRTREVVGLLLGADDTVNFGMI